MNPTDEFRSFEQSLAEYHPERRSARGVYYTPDAVANFMVRSVDLLLKTKFEIESGISDERIQMLDPACGTGVFFHHVLNQVDSPEFARKRLIGFEVMAEPCALAQQLFKGSDIRRLDTLADEPDLPDAPVSVILGNPPYAGHSAHSSAWISNLIKAYYSVDGEPLRESNTKWLQDDYVKFIRYGQHVLDKRASGILAYITNNGFLDNPTFRGMRRSLMRSFHEIYLLDLHGNLKKKETSPGGGRDENVFDIQQGVCIGFFIKKPNAEQPCRIHHASMRGTREAKLEKLRSSDFETTSWQTVYPVEPFFLFVPRDRTAWKAYEQGFPLKDIMPISSLGVLSKRDKLVVATDPDVLQTRIRAFMDPAHSDQEMAEQFKLPLSDKDKWNLQTARSRPLTGTMESILYRPFDHRFIFYDPMLVARMNPRVLGHLAFENLGLIVGRQGAATGDDTWNVVFVTDRLVDQNIFRRGGGTVFPLYLYAPDGSREPNFSQAFLSAMQDRAGDVRPEELFYYIYALLHAPAWRKRYADFLHIDFPRISLPEDLERFNMLVKWGEELVALHLLKRPAAVKQPFETIPESVRNYSVGGYRVCEKWLKDRRGQTLTPEDLNHHRHIIAAVHRTLELMTRIDEIF